MKIDQTERKGDEIMDEAERAKKQARYEELCAKFDNEEEEITDAEIAESTRLYYELHPEEQYWRDTHPELTPEDLWPLP